MSKKSSWFLPHHASLITCFALTLIALAACSPQLQSYRAEFLALGTTTSITVVSTSRPHAQTGIQAAESEIQRLGHEWYPWRKDGELVRLNEALASGRSHQVSPQLLDVLQRSRSVFQLSGGAFDPTLGSLVKMWGFDQAGRSDDALAANAPPQPLPTETQLRAWQTDHPTFNDIEWRDNEIRSKRRDVVIDLGAIGKGYAVDRAIELLRDAGIDRAMVNAGGNLRAIGNNLEGPWRIAIRNPRSDGALYTLTLRSDESVSTSGDDQRFIIAGSHRWPHLLDPRDGLPAEHTIAVTVLAADATTADAASTALFVAGPREWQAVARKLGLRSILRIDASGRLQITRELFPRLNSVKSDRDTADLSQANRDAGSIAVEIVDL